MDEVAVATTNPVQTVVAPKPKGTGRPKPPGTIKNFFFMFPLAVVIMAEAFLFGQAVGGFTTFPIFTVHGYMVLGALAVLMLLVQVFLRSIIYSTLFGCFLVAGIFHAWFGDFWNPVIQNAKEILSILQSSWSAKSVPYPILVSGLLGAAFLVVAAGNFLCSLIVKYFFEIVFGTEWSDGRRNAFLFTIVGLLALHLGFGVYHRGIAGGDRVLWKAESRYQPIEEYLVRIPSAAQIGPGFLWAYDPAGIAVFEDGSGRELRRRDARPTLYAPSWSRVAYPFVAGAKEITFFDRDLMVETGHCPYPTTFTGVADITVTDGNGESRLASAPVVPLLVRPDVSPDHLLVMFDYGVWGAVSPASGAFLWTRAIDAQSRFNPLNLEEFLTTRLVLRLGDLLCFSCNNGRIVGVKADTGETVWEYNHPEAKYSGKGQRALLGTGKGLLLAAFPSGSIVALELAKGTVVHEAKSVEWHPTTPPSYQDGDVTFLSAEGNIIRAELDGGRGKMKFLAAENRLPLMPIAVDLDQGFLGYRETLFHIASGTREVAPVMTMPRHLFATTPVFEDQLMFIGTQDGWVLCLHAGSLHEKWRVYVGGELGEDSLALSEKGLLVRTKSGSIWCLRKTIG
ncbi:MAG: PQQ-binding-like beta-propeller repeat protein [Candidatus Riflebacteria bacterium]|nr:PQQ-binding-like beta-propeller repeat protein [Candidatus Riflebacteria bacterium]